MPEIVVCGPSSWNQLVYLADLPQPTPQTLFAERSYDTLGGTSAGKALHLAALGRGLILRTIVGDDEAARSILGALRSGGVTVDPLTVDGGSERHLNLMTGRGERVSIYLHLPAAPSQPPTVDDLRGARAVVLDLAPWTRDLAARVVRGDLPLWTDLHDVAGDEEFHRPFLGAATHVLLSGERLAAPTDFLHRAVDDGATLAVCTLAADGAVAVDGEHREWRVKAEPVDVVDSNGAGDGFFAGFLDAHLSGANVGACLEAGTRQARVALQSEHLAPSVG